MDGIPPEEPNGAAGLPPRRPGWPSAALEKDKKTVFWMGGVMECFSSVLSLFNKTDMNPATDEDWEVPFSDLSEFVFLGCGAQGTVFRSYLKGEVVAIKHVRDKSETNIKHLRKLNHENIVRFRGISTNGNFPCIIMEYCQYGPLFEFLHSGSRISAEQTFKWAKDIALGMGYLHSNRIIHRDLKSPNILITDNLTVKVSDFGTAREWDSVSAIMSFTGTVAWMAPEVIRHEPCSERVDVWSYGVVLWELLTQEIPYKNVETHAIMWGVGTDTLSLPIPISCPEHLQALLTQCWHRTPRLRPPFKIIAADLEVTGQQYAQSQGDCFSATQTLWRKEIEEGMTFEARPSAGGIQYYLRREDTRSARDWRQIYEQQMARANELYLEVCAIKLQLEQREQRVAERERAVGKICRCGIRKNLKYVQQEPSSSSDNAGASAPNPPPPPKAQPAQVVVNFVNKGDKTVTIAVSPDKVNEVVDDVSACACNDSVVNNNVTVKKKEIVKKETSIKLKDMPVEPNGNIIKRRGRKNDNNNRIPDIAQV